MISIDINKRLHGVSGEMSLDVKLDIKENSFVSISGKSGSGKTTLLRILAGLERASGEIKVGSEVWLDSKINLATQKRKIGFVFQDYALFENMSVEQNLLFVSKDKKLASHLLKITYLEALKERYTGTLSGGQQQRVSLCRAMMNEPKLLLMDEPLSALDSAMRVKLQDEILQMQQEFGTTTLMISHDPSEIYKLSERVVILDNGKVINDGTPKEVLLKTKGSQKFSFDGKILDMTQIDVIYVAVVSIGQQIVEVVISELEMKNLKIGDSVNVSTKAFAPIINKKHL